MRPIDTSLRLLSRGDMIADGLYRTHSRFRRAVNMTDGRRVVSIVDRGVEPGPVNLVVARLDPRMIRTLRVDGRSISVNGAAIPTRGALDYSSELDVGDAEPGLLRRGLRSLRALLKERAPAESLAFLIDPARVSALRGGFWKEFSRHMRACADDILFGDPIRGAARARGRGFGLTPSGDDLIVGLLVSMNLLERVACRHLARERRMVREAAGTGALIAETALGLAEEGRVFETMKGLVRALVEGRVSELSRAVDRILAVGATSGADAAVGLLLGLERGFACGGWTGRPSAGHGHARSGRRSAAPTAVGR